MRPVPLALGAFGSLFLGVGLWLLLTEGPQREAARVAALPAVDPAGLASRALGETVLLEGRIDAATPAGFRDFVAWRREQFEGVEDDGPNKGREIWRHLETVAPPLRLDASGGVVAITNSGYELRAAPHDWRESTSTSGGFFARRPERAAGFRAGDAVVVEGRIVAEPGAEGGVLATRGLAAAVLSSGDRAAYVAAVQSAIRATKIVGAAFTPVGVFVIGLASWLGFRPRRADPDAGPEAGRGGKPRRRR